MYICCCIKIQLTIFTCLCEGEKNGAVFEDIPNSQTRKSRGEMRFLFLNGSLCIDIGLFLEEYV